MPAGGKCCILPYMRNLEIGVGVLRHAGPTCHVAGGEPSGAGVRLLLDMRAVRVASACMSGSGCKQMPLLRSSTNNLSTTLRLAEPGLSSSAQVEVCYTSISAREPDGSLPVGPSCRSTVKAALALLVGTSLDDSRRCVPVGIDCCAKADPTSLPKSSYL